MGSKWCMKPPESWSSQLRILFGWGKKGSGLTRLVGQVRFPSRILFFLWKKKVLTPHKFYRSAISRGLRRLWTFSEKYYVTADPFCRERKKRIPTLLGSIKPLKPPLRSEHAFRNVRFAFCVLVVPSIMLYIQQDTCHGQDFMSYTVLVDGNSQSTYYVWIPIVGWRSRIHIHPY